MNRDNIILNTYRKKLPMYDTIMITKCAKKLADASGITVNEAVIVLAHMGIAMITGRGGAA